MKGKDKMKKRFKNFTKLFLAISIMLADLAPSFIVFADNQLPSLDVSLSLNATGEYETINDSTIIDHNATPVTEYNFKITAKNLEDDENYVVDIKYDFYGMWQNEDSITPNTTFTTENCEYDGLELKNGQKYDFNLSDNNIFSKNNETKNKNGVYKITYIVRNASEVEIINKTIDVNVIGYKNEITINEINYQSDVTSIIKDAIDPTMYIFDYTKDTAVNVDTSVINGNLNPKGYFTMVQSINELPILTKTVYNYEELASDKIIPILYTNSIDGIYNYNISFYSNDNKLVLSKNIKFKVVNSSFVSSLPAGTTLSDYLNDSSNPLMERLIIYSVLDDAAKETIDNKEEIDTAQHRFTLKSFDSALNAESYGLTFDSYKDVKDEDIAVLEGIKSKMETVGEIPTVNDFITRLKLAYRYKITDSTGWNADVTAEKTDLINFMDVSILNREGEEALGTDILETGMKVFITIYGKQLSYNIIINGNIVSENGELKNADVLEAIDLAIGTSTLSSEYYLAADVNRDDTDVSTIGVNIRDVSQLNYMIDNDTQNINDTQNDENDQILASIEGSKSSLRVGDKFDLSFKLAGFNEDGDLADVINGIQGKLNYDKSLIKLSSVNVNSNYSWDGNINTISGSDFGKFLYVGNKKSKINSDSIIVTFTFEAIKAGNAKITAEDLVAVYNGVEYDLTNASNKTNQVNVEILRKLSDNNNIKKLTFNNGELDRKFNPDVLNYTLYVTHTLNEIKIDGSLVSEYAKTGAFKTYELNDDVTYIRLAVSSEIGVEKVYTVKVVKVDYRSTNNYLSSLIVKDHEINFNKLKNNYDLTVGHDVDSLDVTAIAESEKAVVTITGNNDLKEGSNQIKITVKAENEDVREYVINVTKEAKPEEENNTTKILIIVLIIATLSGLSYLLFSDSGKSKPKNTFLDDEPVLSRKIENPKTEQKSNNNNNNRNNNHQRNNKNKR